MCFSVKPERANINNGLVTIYQTEYLKFKDPELQIVIIGKTGVEKSATG